MATQNPYNDGTNEFHAWHEGYEGRIYLNTCEGLNNIYGDGRQAAVNDCLKGALTDMVKEVHHGHIYYVLKVNGIPIFKSMMAPITESLKERLDAALRLP